jgi:uncharacterized delta-60 repeat protein
VRSVFGEKLPTVHRRSTIVSGLVTIAIVSLVFALSPSWARAASANPAPGVGDHGAVVTDLPGTSRSPGGELVVSEDPEGRVLVANSQVVVRYRRSGEIDKSFGRAGFAEVPSPAGGRFRLAGIDSDSQGRVLIAGTFEFARDPIPPPGIAEVSEPGLPREEAIVYRLTSAGEPDPSFGRLGTLTSQLALPPPKNASGVSYEATTVELTGITVDAEDRPVLTGGFLSAVGICRDMSSATFHSAFIARLVPDGAIDETFGDGGVLIRGAWILALAPDILRSGVIFFSAISGVGGFDGCETGTQRVLVRMQPDGHLDPLFADGSPRYLSLATETPVVDPAGGIYITSRSKSSTAAAILHVRRLTPAGRRDLRFAGDGAARIALTNGSCPRMRSALAAGPDGDAFVGRVCRGSLWVTHLSAGGRRDTRFGDRGFQRSRLPGALRSPLLLLGNSPRVIAVAEVTDGRHPAGAFALFRYRAASGS